MKFIGKLLLYILIALLVVIAGLYFLLQTRWGAEHISAWGSENSDYHLAFGAMDHRFSAPSHIVLKNVTFGRDGQPATLVAKSVDIALSSRQLTEPRHVDTILLENGTLNLTDQTAPLPFKADRLQLRDMAFNSPNSEWKLSAQRVNGGVVPWSPEAGKVLGTKAQIQFSAGSLSLNDVPATNVLIEGSIDNDRVTLTNLGADIARGTLTGKPAHGGYPSTKRKIANRLLCTITLCPVVADWSPGSHRRSFARSGLGGDRPRSQLAQHDLQ